MQQKCRFIGVPGAGKTTRGMEVLEKVQQRGIPLSRIAYCTFTRSARREASARASELFRIPMEQLERTGWFRTIHSASMRCIGAGRNEVCNFDKEWIRDALGEEGVAPADDGEEDGWVTQWQGNTPAVTALLMWDVARQSMMPLREVYDRSLYRGGIPRDVDGPHQLEMYIDRYEEAKRRDGKRDFTDFLMEFTGGRQKVDGLTGNLGVGDPPDIDVIILDESQDTSPLLDLAAQKLAARCRWVYLMGDREQGIYAWGGADPGLFMRWNVAHEEYLKKSWRCAQRIIDLGLSLIRRNDDISPQLHSLQVEGRCPGGKIQAGWDDDLLHFVDPHEPTLLMARTNYEAQNYMRRLTSAGIPWKSVRTSQRWPPQAITLTVAAMQCLAKGEVIDMESWRRVVKAVPAKSLVRGTKTRYAAAESAKDSRLICVDNFQEFGGTEILKEHFRSGNWLKSLDQAAYDAVKAANRWGDIVEDPVIQVGTIHSTKGMGVDKVILGTGVGGPVLRNMQTKEGMEEERRVWYVGLTRARDHLVLLKSRGRNFDEIYDLIDGDCDE